MTLLYVFAALIALNLWTMLRFRDDKRRAVAGARRLPESRLLGLALIGGSPGALAARRLFRHKTHKQPFSTWLHLIVAAQLLVLAGMTALRLDWP